VVRAGTEVIIPRLFVDCAADVVVVAGVHCLNLKNNNDKDDDE